MHNLTSLTGISGSQSGGYAVDAEGIAWGWGGNVDGNVGDGTTANTSEPVQVAGLSNVIQIGSRPAATGGYAIGGF